MVWLWLWLCVGDGGGCGYGHLGAMRGHLCGLLDIHSPIILTFVLLGGVVCFGFIRVSGNWSYV